MTVRGDGPAIVVFHGGSWSRKYGKAVTSFVAADLARRGFTSLNAEYRDWSFSRAGTYRLRFKSTATSRSGKRLSDTATLTVRVR